MAALAAGSLAQTFLMAARVIGAVIEGRNADESLQALNLDPALRPAVMDTVFNTLRRYGRGDLILSHLIERPLSDTVVRGLLLAAVCRLDMRTGSEHTTVDQAVIAASHLARGKYKGLVNGVLRNYLRRKAELMPAIEQTDEGHWQHPPWWIDQLRRERPADWQDILAAGNTHPPMTLRVNQRRTTTPDLLQQLEARNIACTPLADDALRLEKPLSVAALPGFADGQVSVQDWGAQQAARLLDVRPGMRVLDACAAPGGKTAHLLERCPDARLTALEIDAGRARRIVDNLQRLGLSAEVKVADCRDTSAWWDGQPYDRILADVPCSASGVVRRHPDIKWLRRSGDIAGFATTQAIILDALWQTLARGGTMLYATCSVFADENAAQIAAFVARHPDAQRLSTHDSEHEWQLIPNADHDGFFYALLAKA